MGAPTLDAFKSVIGELLTTFSIAKRLNLTVEECYDILTTNKIGKRWVARSILINELCIVFLILIATYRRRLCIYIHHTQTG